MINNKLNCHSSTMKIIAALIFIIKVQIILALKTYNIIPESYGDRNDSETTVNIPWEDIYKDTSRYFTSHTKIILNSGMYYLQEQVLITKVQNLSITGTSSVTVNCANDAAIHINSSTAVRVQHMKFMNCGMSTIYPTLHNFTAAISLLNVQSIVLSNITFENSLGHGIVGINVLGSSTLVNITVYHNNNLSGNSLRPMGGIILVYVNTIDGVHHNQTQLENNVLIQNCTICCMSDQSRYDTCSVEMPSASPIFGLFLHQKDYSINVAIVDTNITGIVSQNLPLVYIAYNSSMNNLVSFSNSIFTNITSKKFPVIELTVFEPVEHHSNKSSLTFQLKGCALSFNRAKLAVFEHFNNYGKVNIEMTSTKFTYNKEAHCVWKSSYNISKLTIADCSFKSNYDFNMQITHIHTVHFTNNLFYNNTSLHPQQSLLDISNNTFPIFQESNEFSFNNANVIISLREVSYIYIKEGSTLNISFNSAKLNTTEQRSLVAFSDNLKNYLCKFQFLSNNGSLDEHFSTNKTINFSLIFHNNHNYTSILYGTLLNSCQWLPNGAFHKTTPGDVYKRIIQYDTTANIITRREATFCYCDKATGEVDCFRDTFITTPVYPGQIIPINLIQVPTPEITAAAAYLWRDVSKLIHQHYAIDKPCELVPYQLLNWKNLVNETCMSLPYRVLTTLFEPCFACFSARGIAKSHFHCYNIGFKQKCPPGFVIHNGACNCNKHLTAAFPTLTCDIDTVTINRPGQTWIAYNTEGIILYVEKCENIFCRPEPTKLQLDKPDTQCVGNRTGLQCGQCPPGLSAVFGSFKCKKCSKDMLWLLPVFFIAGILLVFFLFTLNLTVVDGTINGFILYANLTVITNYYIFPSPSLFTVMSLCNLDLGIETCFYHSMTEYDKTWLQFVFPLYLLCIVGVLAITSRYSSYVERLTRKRVISVISTIFLLSYNKIVLVTAKVLFSFTTVHKVDGNKTDKMLIWQYSHESILGIKFILLFIACLLVFLLILLPQNFLLIFTKFSYKWKFVSRYLKPYLDAYQAPFKISQYYYFGMELLTRPILFAVGNTHARLQSFQLVTIYAGVWVIISFYLCTFKPFKSTRTAILHISYIINLGCQILLFLYYSTDITNTSFAILHTTLILIALTEFGCTVLYSLYKSHLYKFTIVSTVRVKVSRVLITLKERLRRRIKSKDAELLMTPIPSAVRYEQLREEMLTADPSK